MIYTYSVCVHVSISKYVLNIIQCVNCICNVITGGLKQLLLLPLLKRKISTLQSVLQWLETTT